MSNETDKLIDPSFTEELNSFFDNFLKEGVVIREKEIVPGFKIKIKVLNTEELLLAESILSSSNPQIPHDVIIKVRAASILSQAILNLNDMAIDREDLSDPENNTRRHGLYKQILKMPAIMIQKAYEFYVDAVREQNALYEDTEKLGKKIENF